MNGDEISELIERLEKMYCLAGATPSYYKNIDDAINALREWVDEKQGPPDVQHFNPSTVV